MEKGLFEPAKLLITVVGKYSGELVLAAAKRGGARGGTKAMGRGLAEYFTGGENTGQEVTEALIFTLMYDEADSVVAEVIQAGLKDPEHIRGLALVIAAAALVRPMDGPKNATEAPKTGFESERMSTGNTLITCIITRGQADEVMLAAREAGARGGTILGARGTGTEDDVKFFGISLAPEKEILLIVASSADAPGIMKAVGDLLVFSEPGGGIVYTTPVEEFHLLGS